MSREDRNKQTVGGKQQRGPGRELWEHRWAKASSAEGMSRPTHCEGRSRDVGGGFQVSG